MRNPRIMIGGKVWKFRWETKPTLDGSPVDGFCDYANMTIVLRIGMTRERAQEVCYHECFHAQMRDIDEYAVEQAANAGRRLWRRNKARTFSDDPME